MKDLSKLSESEMLELFQVEELETRLEMWGGGGDANCNGSCNPNSGCNNGCNGGGGGGNTGCGGGGANAGCGTNTTCGGGGGIDIPIEISL